MLTETNKDDLIRITNSLNCSSTLCTSFEFNGYVFEMVRKDYYLEQHYKNIPYTEK